jgi:hypothetical protein
MDLGRIPDNIDANSLESLLQKDLDQGEVLLLASWAWFNGQVIFTFSNMWITVIDSKSYESKFRILTNEVRRIQLEENLLRIEIDGKKKYDVTIDRSDCPIFEKVLNFSGLPFSCKYTPVKQEPKVNKPSGASTIANHASGSAARGRVGGHTVEIFRNGTVRIDGSAAQELLAISSNINVTNKTGIGRAVGQSALAIGSGFLLSGGSANRRGTVHLVVVTARQTYSMSENLNSLSAASKNYESEATVLKLDAAGNAAIQAKKNTNSNNSSSENFESEALASQILKIADLYQQGLLTEEEFIQAKAKLLE